ncbi:MAG TPA: ATP-binding protein [Solirubrobacteraceae bacterium]|jgi:anti-sigma regulatory factor (Ser/Thr protein kinase)|nr:ATP-binding protein [Solirubrobacteraceae bacterium]
MSVSFSIHLVPDLTASRIARETVRRRIAGEVPPAILADVMLAVSELVTNAVIHGSGPIELRIETDDRVVKGEVIDAGGGLERQVRAGEATGKGLKIVGQLAERWGVFQGTTHVWFEIPIDGSSGRPSAPALGRPDDGDRPGNPG